jgi:hypothetical protein
MLHILAANAREDTALVRKAAKTRTSLEWIVPKRALPANRALFHLPGIGLAAKGAIATEPRAVEGRYCAQVHKVEMLLYPAPLTFLRKHHPNWKWLTYPKSYTSIDGEVEVQLEELIKSDLLKRWWEETAEGEPKTVELTRYERNPIARRQCIEHYGTDCYVCRFSFGRIYGEKAAGTFKSII